jgi:DNA-binding MarR family transcriptional regulator
MEAIGDKCYGTRVAELLHRLNRAVRQMEFDAGLNPAQWDALRFLNRANRISRTPGCLAQFLNTTRGTASQTLIALAAKGYIEKVACESDRRVTYLNITPAGRAILETDPLKRVNDLAKSLPDDLEPKLIEGLSCLLGRLKADTGCKQFGVCSSCQHLRDGDADSERTAHRCGLTGEPLCEMDTTLICVNHLSREQTAGDHA